MATEALKLEILDEEFETGIPKSNFVKNYNDMHFIPRSSNTEYIKHNAVNGNNIESGFEIVKLEKHINNIFRFNFSKPPQDHFIVLQRWEGTVLQILEETFVARLIDLTSKNNIDEKAEFLIEEISEDQRDLLKVGGIFNWSIGYIDKSGQRMRNSLIRFRRLPVWQENDLIEASEKAQKYSRLLLLNDDESTTSER